MEASIFPLPSRDRNNIAHAFVLILLQAGTVFLFPVFIYLSNYLLTVKINGEK